MDNNNVLSVPLPKMLQTGHYVMRAEMIGLHGAWGKASHEFTVGNSVGDGAQLFVRCADLQINGATENYEPDNAIIFPNPSLYSAVQITSESQISKDSLGSFQNPGPPVANWNKVSGGSPAPATVISNNTPAPKDGGTPGPGNGQVLETSVKTGDNVASDGKTVEKAGEITPIDNGHSSQDYLQDAQAKADAASIHQKREHASNRGVHYQMAVAEAQDQENLRMGR